MSRIRVEGESSSNGIKGECVYCMLHSNFLLLAHELCTFFRERERHRSVTAVDKNVFTIGKTDVGAQPQLPLGKVGAAGLVPAPSPGSKRHAQPMVVLRGMKILLRAQR